MKSRFFTFGLLVVVLLSFGAIKNGEVGKIDAKIKEAESLIFGPSGPGDNPKKGFELLLDAIEMTAPHTEFSPEFKNKIAEVKKISKETSFLNPEGIALLNKAYRSINDGKDFQMPKSISQIKDAVVYARSQIETARKDLNNGKYNNSVKLLLETCLMIVTPVEKKIRGLIYQARLSLFP
ncbi:MAG: hypothetical protein JSV96_11940 [Candidatus Aminicenantes bacterium]|nr:MAG: hypothetical protein JSV96_11940 [Candidatus Aminicenantes bacterium]